MLECRARLRSVHFGLNGLSTFGELLLMGTLTALTFVTPGAPGEDKTFYTVITPGPGEGFLDPPSAEDITFSEPGIALPTPVIDYGTMRATVTHEWVSGRKYKIAVTFTKTIKEEGIP
jgi:hypothetical protein